MEDVRWMMVNGTFMYSEIHPRKVRDSSLESLTFIPALSEFPRRFLKRRDNLRKRYDGRSEDVRCKIDDGRVIYKIEKTMPPVPVLSINRCISGMYGRRSLIKTMP